MHQTADSLYLHEASGKGSALDLLCLVLSGDPATRETASAAWAEPVTRRAIVDAAICERAVAALHDAIGPFADLAPKSERVPLALSYEANRRRNHTIGEAVVELGAGAHRHSIELVALKGSMWVLEDPVNSAAWRPLGDSDVLVEARHLETMREVLNGLGYRPARDERDILGRRRFDGHYHLVQYRRGSEPFVIEVHRDIGWQPRLLPTETIFESRRPIAPGLSLPCPWHAALHCLIHWQLHHYGQATGLGLNEIVEIGRFIGRRDIDWEALARHAEDVGIKREIQDAMAVAAAMIRAPIPEVLRPSSVRLPRRVYFPRDSRLAALIGKQRMRVLRLWDGHRLRYRLNLHKVRPSTIELHVWVLRLRRVPFVAFHLLSILALALVACVHAAFGRLRGSRGGS